MSLADKILLALSDSCGYEPTTAAIKAVESVLDNNDEVAFSSEWVDYMQKQTNVQAKMLELVAALMAPKDTEASRDLEVWRQAYNAAVIHGHTPAPGGRAALMADRALVEYKAKAVELEERSRK